MISQERRSLRLLGLLASFALTAHVGRAAEAVGKADSSPSPDPVGELKAKIYAEYPQLRNPLMSDWERINLLRQWAWSHTNHAFGISELVDINPDVAWDTLDAPGRYKLYEQDRGGSWCGGTAMALQRLYEMFGYQAAGVDSGNPSIYATHVTTLVKIRHKGKDVIVMQDAYFNQGFADMATGDPLDYRDMVGRLARGEHQSIEVIEPDWRDMPVMPALIVAAEVGHDKTSEQIATESFSVLEEHYTSEMLPDGRLKFISPRTAGKFIDKLCHDEDGNPVWMLRWIMDQGHPRNIIYLYLYRVSALDL
jgi:hypothetical protein